MKFDYPACNNIDSVLAVSIIIIIIDIILLPIALSIPYASATTTTTTPYLADGPDRTYNERALVTLEGDMLEGEILENATYFWNQIDGIPVTLSNPSSARPTFTAPDVDNPTNLTFQYRIIVSDGSPSSWTSNWATIRITVNPSIVEPSPPDTTLISAVDGEGVRIEQEGGTTLSSYVKFTFAGRDDIDNPSDLRFECSLSAASGDFQPCTSPREYTDLGYDLHEFQVRAIGGEGDVDPTPAKFTWTILSPTECLDGYYHDIALNTCVRNGEEIPWEIIIGSVAVLVVVAGVIAGLYKAVKRSRRRRARRLWAAKQQRQRPSSEKGRGLGPVTVDVEGDIEDELRGGAHSK